MIENFVEHKTPILVPFCAWRYETALHECFGSVFFVWVEREDSVVNNLNDLSEAGRTEC